MNSIQILLKRQARCVWLPCRATMESIPVCGAELLLVSPGGRTGIHHHGEQETIVYVLEGSSTVRWGEHGESQATVNAGDFLHVPAWTPHMEINPSDDRPFRWIVVRSTPEPIVVNLPDDYWG